MKYVISLVCFFLIINLAAARELPGVETNADFYKISAVTTGSPLAGITVAGGNGYGSASDQFRYTDGIFLDGSGNLYVADGRRIQKWAPGASTGITVAGGWDLEWPASELYIATDVFVDGSGDIYASDHGKMSVQKFTPGSSKGITVAGGFNSGPAANQLDHPSSIFVDAEGNIYVSDCYNHRVQKWAPGATEGVTVAGGRGYGPAPDQLRFPRGIFVDANGNLFVADQLNYRIQKWAPGATSGITVAGGNDFGSAANQLYSPKDVFVDQSENVYVVDEANNRVQKWTPGSSQGITIAGDNGPGSESTQLNDPNSIYVDQLGNIYVSDDNQRVLKFEPPLASGLTYRYYEGTWNTLPDFDTLTPVKSGSSPGIDPGVRTPGRNDNFAFVWNGFLKITTPGIYTFETVSDDGSRFYFNTFYDPAATPIVKNDGIHASASASGMVNIGAPGAYAFCITFFEKEGGEQIEVYWTGPGIERQLIPATAFTQIPPETGLNYKFYTGSWDMLPDFNRISPVKSGTVRNITLNEARQYDYFALLWQGSIYIPAAGEYTFETFSDDGSKLYFNSVYDSAAVATVNNDGLHPGALKTGKVNVALPGFYPFTLSYFEKDNIAERIEVYWTGPGITRQRIPDEAFGGSTIDFVPPASPRNLRALYAGHSYIHVDWDNPTDNDGVAGYEVRVFTPEEALVRSYWSAESASTIDSLNPDTEYLVRLRAVDGAGNLSDSLESFNHFLKTKTIGVSTGLNYRYYEGAWNELPNFNTLTPVKWGLSANVDHGVRNEGVNDRFGLVWEGYINIPAAGTYIFETVSDDGSRLYFNSLYVPGKTALVNNDGLHAATSATGSVTVSAAGRYPISVTFFERDGNETMQLYWSGPGIQRQLIPNSAFMPMPAGSLVLVSGKDLLTSPDEANVTRSPVIHRVYPNPFTKGFNLTFNNSSATNDIEVSIFDLKGRCLYRQPAGQLPKGNPVLKVNLEGHQLPKGIYMVQVNTNGIPSKTVKLVKTE